jgi:hypothetical protein
MWLTIFSFALLSAMAGCVTVGDGPAKSITLRPEQAKVVETEILSRINNKDGAQVGKYLAGTDETGRIIVCGTYYAKHPLGGLLLPYPFMGALEADGKFVPDPRVGAGARTGAEIYGTCRWRGLPIES